MARRAKPLPRRAGPPLATFPVGLFETRTIDGVTYAHIDPDHIDWSKATEVKFYARGLSRDGEPQPIRAVSVPFNFFIDNLPGELSYKKAGDVVVQDTNSYGGLEGNPHLSYGVKYFASCFGASDSEEPFKSAQPGLANARKSPVTEAAFLPDFADRYAELAMSCRQKD